MKKQVIHEKFEFTNVRELIEWAGDHHGERNAYSYREKASDKDVCKVSFKKLRDDVRALTSEFVAMGVDGKHCILIGKFSYQWVLTYYATLCAGGVVVPLDRDWLAEDLADTAVKANISFLFCDEELKEKAAVIAESAKLETPVTYLLAKEEERSLSSLVAEGAEKFSTAPDAYFNAAIDPMRLSLLVFTSGTTGKGKGVMLNQNAILRDMSEVIPYIDFADKTVGVLPPHHTYGSTVMIIGHTMIGCEIYISSGIRYVQRELKDQTPGHMVLVPLYLETFYRKIWANIKEQGKEKIVNNMIKLCNTLHLSRGIRVKLFKSIHAAFGGKVKMIITGGAPVNPDILHFFQSIGISVLNGYGITECAPLISCNRNKYQKKGSVGTPIIGEEVKIADPDENGEGEICVKGPNVMIGYYEDPEATAAVFDEEGFFKTGDYGKVDEEGWLYITGRLKNLIIFSNGKNVYPEEIETELSRIYGVNEVVVYAGESKSNPEKEVIVAEIFPDFDGLKEKGIEDVKAYFTEEVKKANARMVSYKAVGSIKIRNVEFPKNTSKKITRFAIDKSID